MKDTLNNWRVNTLIGTSNSGERFNGDLAQALVYHIY